MKLYVSTCGDCAAVYDDLLNMSFLGELQIRRASHVEPTADSQWTADLSPVGGPQLGPFTMRSQALMAELAWLEGAFCKSHKGPDSRLR